ncbi:DUF488 family protein [Acidithiobacillus sp.]|uniref:DUF488 domain-containing protein n=1 Tax=Acidithiobacillus sp. TaxID=1872118 RepID=UPI0025C4C543|nr:DUF488 domain-containing protein [Acidithiobacillus sp.]
MCSACVAPTEAPKKPIWTVGHGKRPLADFIATLKPEGIEMVVDVRKMPRSSHNPQFNRDVLSTALALHGITYAHWPTLGGLRKQSPDSINGAWRNSSFRAYADYMQTSAFQSALEMLEEVAGQKSLALMCAETLPWRCHRALIADALVAHGKIVIDLLAMGQKSYHKLPAWARVRENGTVYYPSAGSQEA